MADKPSKTTRYVVLAADGNVFAKVGEAEASSANGAIKHVVTAAGDYVAIPERSFQIVPVAVEIPEPKFIIGAPAAEEAVPERKIDDKVATAAREMREELELPIEQPVRS